MVPLIDMFFHMRSSPLLYIHPIKRYTGCTFSFSHSFKFRVWQGVGNGLDLVLRNINQRYHNTCKVKAFLHRVVRMIAQKGFIFRKPSKLISKKKHLESYYS
uniref:Uncharacterized protein n=1 Tax=Cacopsylla melanoneura TaxID=428564 RepID=A0A8D8T089_9HEMI